MEIGEELRARLAALGVAAAWLFGSQVAGRRRPDSDTDVAVLLCDGAKLSLLDRGRIATVLAQALEHNDIDLVVVDDAPLELRAAVVRDGVLIVRIDEPRRVAFEVETVSRWLDVREAVKAMDAAYLARVAREGLA